MYTDSSLVSMCSNIYTFKLVCVLYNSTSQSLGCLTTDVPMHQYEFGAVLQSSTVNVQWDTFERFHGKDFDN